MGLTFFTILGLGLYWNVPSFADEEKEEKVSFDQLPKAVQETIQKETAGGEIEEIEKETKEGTVVYEAEFTKDGKEFELTVAEDGKVLSLEEEKEEAEEEHEEGEDEEELKVDFEDLEVGAVPEGCLIAETAGEGNLGKWQVMEMEGAPSGNKVFALVETKNSGHTFNLAIAEEVQVKDLEIEVKVKALSGEEDQGGGPIWRAKDADNYYIARWNPLENNFRVYFVKEGRRKQLASANVETDPKAWHEIEITMVGDKIVAEFDDKKLIEVTDGTFEEAGMVGVWTKADAATAFDDFEVEEPEDEEHEHHEEKK
jgi:hypothetical protein